MFELHHVLEIEYRLRVLRRIEADLFADGTNHIHLNIHVKVEIGHSPLLNIHVGVVDVVGIHGKA